MVKATSQDQYQTERSLNRTGITFLKRRRKKVNTDSEDINNKTISREQIVLWAYEAGFPTNYARNEITRFEKLTHLVQKYLERDYK